jgi:hypothetical protein
MHLVACGLAKSNKEANQKIKEGAVAIDGLSWRGRGFQFWVPKEGSPAKRIFRLGRNIAKVEITY